MKTTLSLSAIAAALLLSATASQAQLHTVKSGLIRYDSNSKTTGIQGIGVPAGADAQVGDASTLMVSFERALTPQVGVEVVLGIPPRIKARATGTVAFLGEDVLSAKNVAPTVLINYHFGAATDTWRPYVGLGVNFTRFAGVESKLAPQVQMSDSVGMAFVGGVDYAINRQWGLYASVSAVDVRSNLVGVANTVLTTTINFRPVVYAVGASFKF